MRTQRSRFFGLLSDDVKLVTDDQGKAISLATATPGLGRAADTFNTIANFTPTGAVGGLAVDFVRHGGSVFGREVGDQVVKPMTCTGGWVSDETKTFCVSPDAGHYWRLQADNTYVVNLKTSATTAVAAADTQQQPTTTANICSSVQNNYGYHAPDGKDYAMSDDGNCAFDNEPGVNAWKFIGKGTEPTRVVAATQTQQPSLIPG